MLPYILFIYNSFINNIYLFIKKICLFNGIYSIRYIMAYYINIYIIIFIIFLLIIFYYYINFNCNQSQRNNQFSHVQR